MPEQKKPIEFILGEDGTLRQKPSKGKKPEPFPWLALLIFLGCLGTFLYLNFTPRSVAPSPQEQILPLPR
jgi:hypothetical protein